MGKEMSSDGALAIEEEFEQEPPRSAQPTAPPAPDYNLEKGSKIIRSGNMHFEVGDLTKAKQKVDGYVKSLDGYYEDESYQEYGHRNQYHLKIRLPSERFDSLLTLLEAGVAGLKVKNITANDVTEQYVDLKIRLDNKLAALDQYRSILKKAKSVTEVLEVQERIRRLEEEIESKKGRLRFLEDKVRFAELRLDLSQLIERPLTNTPSFGLRLKNAFINGVSGFLSFIVGMVNVWPFLLLLLILLLARHRLRRLIRGKG